MPDLPVTPPVTPPVTLPVTPSPFPHIVVDGWWDDELLRAVLDEFPSVDAPGWRRYASSQERKLEGPPGLWGRRTRELFATIKDQTANLEKAFGIPDMQMETIGGGYHCIEPGGHLQMHSDFSISPRTGWFRRLNLLIYLNDNWDDPGGCLELWNAQGREVVVAPEFNRTVVFQTSATSWHGHPIAAQRWRRSVAAYFFTQEKPPDYAGDQSTVWHVNAGV
jgi:hypothetical protein